MTCFGLGLVGMVIGWGTSSQDSEATDRLRNWPRAEGTVVRTEVLRTDSNRGTLQEIHCDEFRTTVAFTPADGRPREGLVFDGRQHARGETLWVYFDPQVEYRHASAFAGREVYTEERLWRGANSNNRWSAAAWIAGGAALALFGGVRLYRANATVRHLPARFGQRNESLGRPGTP